MFLVNGNPILADELEVLTELKTQLAFNEIYRFNQFRVTTNHIQFNCPIHKGGQELKPSCGITTNTITYPDGRTVPSGRVHCFGCGYTASLEEMISHCFGKNDLGAFGRDWLIKNFLTVSIESRKPLDISFDRKRSKTVEKPKYISEEELDSYRYTHPYMYKRKLTDEVIEMFDIGYDNDFQLVSRDGNVSHMRCITFPVRDVSGGTLFIARRSVDTKFFHYPSEALKPVYGLYELYTYYEEFPKEIIVCESMLNALTCWVYGKPAVALNGTGTPYQYNQLLSLPCRKFVLGLDPDDAGFKGRQRFRNFFNDKRIVTDLEIPTGKDINDLSDVEFKNLLEFF